MKYSDDTSSKYKGGDIGMLMRSNQQQKQFYGSDFFDAVFRLKKGETSGVIQSNLGLPHRAGGIPFRRQAPDP